MQTSQAPAIDLPSAPRLAEPKSLPALRVIRHHRLALAAGLVILIAGLALRLSPFFGVPDHKTLDEGLYIYNVKLVQMVGPFQYPALVERYVEKQSAMSAVMLPPTRCMYILLAWAWDAMFHTGPMMALRTVAAIFSTLSFLLAGLFAYRLGGVRYALVVGALMAVAPMELMLAHRELVDGVFAFWALLCLWLLWENLERPGKLGWLAAYAGAIACMVLTKENAFFAAVGLGGTLCAMTFVPGLKTGRPAWSLFIATFAGGVMGALVLVCMAGSVHTLLETYHLLVVKAEKMDFAYQTGGGPWFRYLVDLMLISPMVLLPAIGGIFALRRDNREGVFLFLFVLFSCAVMVNVKNGMNVRYATMWDMPLRFLAAGILLQMAGCVRRAPVLAAVALVALIGASELHHYWLYFVKDDIGEPVTQYLMWASQIVRTGPAR
ncbi:MAG TPA: hypothetical protein VHY22_15940 [Chthoniobacteraceae bacterium]|jgi:4-amino-4-deoxy-L-arabinose transferase-like glycosyltransferase|nr:hypothetical protein [Chthoniobacteraceae bacterium]